VGDHYLAGGTLESETDIQQATVSGVRHIPPGPMPQMMLAGADPGDSYNPVSHANINIKQQDG